MLVDAHQIVRAANRAVKKMNGPRFGVVQLVLAALDDGDDVGEMLVGRFLSLPVSKACAVFSLCHIPLDGSR